MKKIITKLLFITIFFISCKKDRPPLSIKFPDLTCSLFFSDTTITQGGTIQKVIQIRNIGKGATTAPIVFSLTTFSVSTGLSLSPNNSPMVTIGSNTYTLSNADWDFSANVGAFTSKPGVVIPAGGFKNVGVTISRGVPPNHGANGFLSNTVVIFPGTGGGETPTTNNTVFNTLIKN